MPLLVPKCPWFELPKRRLLVNAGGDGLAGLVERLDPRPYMLRMARE